MTILGGPAQPVVVSTRPPGGGPAIPVAVVGGVAAGGPAIAVVEVSDNRPRMGGPAMPVVVASGAAASGVGAGAPIPVYVVSGSLAAYDYIITVSAGTYTARNAAGTVVATNTVLLNVVNAVKGANRHIHFGPGTFDFGTDHATFNNLANLTISGSGMDVTFIQNNTNAAADTEPLSYTDCDGAVVMDMTISAGGTARSTSDALDFDHTSNGAVYRVKITLSRARGIVYDGKDVGANANGNIIQDCIVSGCPGSGIELLAASNNQIINCTVTGCSSSTGAGISITKASASAGQPNKKANSNLVQNCTASTNSRDGVRILSCDGNTISGGTFQNNGQGGTTFDGIRINTQDSITADSNVIDGVLANDTQGTKTQRYGCNVGPTTGTANTNTIENSNFRFNKTASINNAGTGTILLNNLT